MSHLNTVVSLCLYTAMLEEVQLKVGAEEEPEFASHEHT